MLKLSTNDLQSMDINSTFIHHYFLLKIVPFFVTSSFTHKSALKNKMLFFITFFTVHSLNHHISVILHYRSFLVPILFVVAKSINLHGALWV